MKSVEKTRVSQISRNSGIGINYENNIRRKSIGNIILKLAFYFNLEDRIALKVSLRIQHIQTKRRHGESTRACLVCLNSLLTRG